MSLEFYLRQADSSCAAVHLYGSGEHVAKAQNTSHRCKLMTANKTQLGLSPSAALQSSRRAGPLRHSDLSP
jgi:hypothetical protein